MHFIALLIVCWYLYNLQQYRPLGPFVPAPPEVAMQMLREQGGPSSYDAPGRKMRSGHHMGGQAPIIAVPPAFRADPRRMRR